MKQSWVSNCENPKYDGFSLRTLKKFASAFDVGLVVRFAPFSELAEWELNMSPESLEVPSFEQEEEYFKEKAEGQSGTEALKMLYSDDVARQTDTPPKVFRIADRKQRDRKRTQMEACLRPELEVDDGTVIS